jgi:trehalose utilization protein
MTRWHLPRVALIVCWMVGCLGVQALAEPAPATRPSGRSVVRVVVWDEQQPEQKATYGDFLGNTIAGHLRSLPGFSVKSVRLDDPDQGVTDEILDACDVLIWWGHVRNREVKESVGTRIVERIKAGKLSLIALHSAHWSQPFVAAMYERAIQDVMKTSAPEAKAGRITCIFPRAFVPPVRGSRLTPYTEPLENPDGTHWIQLALPICCFPAWRADGKPSHVTTLLPKHPIAEGVPTKFDIPQTEMYDEPFHVPPPDAVVFEEKWDAGEHFRSGCVWDVGKGKVFYFRPGHETYPVYRQEIPLKILENACRWLRAELPAKD